jgi:hypothetical protein
MIANFRKRDVAYVVGQILTGVSEKFTASNIRAMLKAATRQNASKLLPCQNEYHNYQLAQIYKTGIF